MRSAGGACSGLLPHSCAQSAYFSPCACRRSHQVPHSAMSISSVASWSFETPWSFTTCRSRSSLDFRKPHWLLVECRARIGRRGLRQRRNGGGYTRPRRCSGRLCCAFAGQFADRRGAGFVVSAGAVLIAVSFALLWVALGSLPGMAFGVLLLDLAHKPRKSPTRAGSSRSIRTREAGSTRFSWRLCLPAGRSAPDLPASLTSISGGPERASSVQAALCRLQVFPLGSPEHAAENRIDVLQVIAEVEHLFELVAASLAVTSLSALSSVKKSAPCSQVFMAFRCTMA